MIFALILGLTATQLTGGLCVIVMAVCFARLIESERTSLALRAERRITELRERIGEASTREELLALRGEVERFGKANTRRLHGGAGRLRRMLRWVDAKLACVPRAVELYPSFPPTEAGLYAVIGTGWRRVRLKEIEMVEGVGLVVLDEADEKVMTPLPAFIKQCERDGRGELRWSGRLGFEHTERSCEPL